MGFHYHFHQYLYCRIAIKLFIRPICMDYWIPILVLPGQPEPNKYGYPPFMHQEPLHSQEHFEPQPPTPAEQEVRKKVRKRRKKR